MIGPVCPSCGIDFITRPRAMAHMMRGALACTLPWRTGALPEFSEEEIRQADEFDRQQRIEARRKGQVPGVGIPLRPVAQNSEV